MLNLFRTKFYPERDLAQERHTLFSRFTMAKAPITGHLDSTIVSKKTALMRSPQTCSLPLTRFHQPLSLAALDGALADLR